MTVDISSRINSQVHRALLFAQIETNAAKWIGQHFMVQMNNDANHTAKQSNFLMAEKLDHGQVSHLSHG